MTAVSKIKSDLGPWPDPAELPAGGAAAALRSYASNPLFRSASIDELVIDDNPYRRPVRPEDLEWLRFDEPPGRADYAQLSALLGHRMLLNIYEAARPMLPLHMSDDRWHDFSLFYGPENRERGERVRPFLEHHLFDFVHRACSELDLENVIDGPAAAGGLLGRAVARREAEIAELTAAVASSARPARAEAMLAIQLLGSALSQPVPLTPAAAAATGLAPAQPFGHLRGSLAGELAKRSGLGGQPHQYYQFYLPSTLALMNYANATLHCQDRVFLFLGVMAMQAIDSAVWSHSFRDGKILDGSAADGESAQDLPSPPGGIGALAQGATGSPPANMSQIVPWLSDHLMEPVARRFGHRGLHEISRGLSEYATLLSVQHDDLSTQLRWIDAAAECRAKAERLQAAITEHAIPVDLDTFVESWEECSTTHVHDDDRLLVIESGEMTFWNCFGDNHTMKPGDKLYVPRHRLHGSVVMSGQCVYHQPVITPELNQRYG